MTGKTSTVRMIAIGAERSSISSGHVAFLQQFQHGRSEGQTQERLSQSGKFAIDFANQVRLWRLWELAEAAKVSRLLLLSECPLFAEELL